jgi:hypothetical protein
LALAEHNKLIDDYEPIDREAAWLSPVKGTTAAGLEAAIAQTLQVGKWFVSSLKDGKVLIEPRETRPIQIEPPEGPKRGRESISQGFTVSDSRGFHRIQSGHELVQTVRIPIP